MNVDSAPRVPLVACLTVRVCMLSCLPARKVPAHVGKHHWSKYPCLQTSAAVVVCCAVVARVGACAVCSLRVPNGLLGRWSSLTSCRDCRVLYSSLDEMGSRIDELEKSIGELMNQVRSYFVLGCGATHSLNLMACTSRLVLRTRLPSLQNKLSAE